MVQSFSLGIGLLATAVNAEPDSFESHPCEHQDHYYAALNSSTEQEYIYEEFEPGSTLSSAQFSYWENGQKVWAAQAERLCTSAGVSFCGVSLPFPAGADLITHVDAPMTTFQTETGQGFIVFAHLWENSYDELRYFYQHSGFPYVGIFKGLDAEDRSQFVLPTVFERRQCQ